MRAALDGGRVEAVLLDIEGTTTGVDFVYRVLFPYAREHVHTYLERHVAHEAVRADLARLRKEHEVDAAARQNPPPWSGDSPATEIASAVAYVNWLMDRDRKSTALKSLQGKIWEGGYRSGALRAHVFPDVPRALARWRVSGRRVAIFSSGSVLAQKLLFAHTTEGDLTPLLTAYFDTTTGSKTAADSYRRIAAALECDPPALLFVSDATAELDAASSAGLATVLCVRSDETLLSGTPHPAIRSFDELP